MRKRRHCRYLLYNSAFSKRFKILQLLGHPLDVWKDKERVEMETASWSACYFMEGHFQVGLHHLNVPSPS